MVCETQAAPPPPGSFAYRSAGGHARRMPLADVEHARAPVEGEFTWVHLDGSDGACLTWLNAGAGLPETVVDALEAMETRPRATPLEHGALVNLRGLAVHDDETADELVSVRLFAERGRVLTVSYHPLLALGDVIACVEAGSVRDPGDVIAAFADAITARLDPVVAALGDRLDDLEGRFAGGDTSLRSDLGAVRREAVEYRRFLLPQRDALLRLPTGDFPWLAEDDRAHIREAGDRAQRMAEELDAVRERAGVLSDQLTDQRSDMANQRMLLLSIVSAIFLPLTFLTGLLGMNVEGIPGAHHQRAFEVVAAVSVTLGVAMVLWFRHRRWF